MILSATSRRTGWLLLGHVDHAHAAFADLLGELVGADVPPRPFADRGIDSGSHLVGHGIEEAVILVVHAQQGVQPRPETLHSRHGPIEIGSPPVRIGDLASRIEDRGLVEPGGIHERLSIWPLGVNTEVSAKKPGRPLEVLSTG